MMHSSLSWLLGRLLLNVDLQWTYCFKTINVSIDRVVIQYLMSLWEKIYSIENTLKSVFVLFVFIIANR